MDNTIEAADGINSAEEQALEIIADTDSVEVIKQKYERAEQARLQITARAKKAEAELKTLKQQNQNLQDKPTDSLSRDEVILLAQGVDEKSLELLKKIQKVNGGSLLQAKEDELFKTYQEKLEREKLSEKSRLGASRGSGRIETKSVSSMSRDDHAQAWKEAVGR